LPLLPSRQHTLPMVETAFLALALVSKSPPAIIRGDVQGVKNFELAGSAGLVCSADVDGDGADESFFVTESWGEVSGFEEDYPVLFKIIVEADGNDTVEVAAFPVFGGETIFMSVGFLDANPDRVKDMAVGFWDDSGTSCLRIYDLAGLDQNARPRITELRPGLRWASYDIAWPVVKVKSPYGKREYAWKEGEWVEAE
jgi:hypothetical protein